LRKVFFAIIIFAMLGIETVSFGQEEIPYGISIDQNSLDILTLASEQFDKLRYSNDYDQTISIRAKVIVADVFSSDTFSVDLPDMIFNAQIELIKTQPDIVRVDLNSNFGEIQFQSSNTESLTVFPQERVFAKAYFPEMLPANLIFPDDNTGLFTMINIFGGLPFGSFFTNSPIGDDGTDISYVDEIAPEDLKAVVRYRGMDKTEGGIAYVITINSISYDQYIKIWVLKDTLQPYQFSIEDKRGTEIFVVFTDLDTSAIPSSETITIDTNGMNEISKNELFGMFLMKVASSPVMESPVVADLYLSHDPVARTGSVLVSSDGFDMQDKEDQLICEINYKSTSTSWTPLKTEYAGVPPIGHWNAELAIPIDAELGKYSLRVRYTDTSGNISGWVEYPNIITVTLEPPRVIKAIPRDLATDVPVSTKISAAFSKPMNKESVEKSFAMVSQNGRMIKGAFFWEDKTMIFTPNIDLEYNTRYLIRIAGKAIDVDNVSLDGNFDAISNGEYYDDYIWEFTTGKVAPALAFAPVNRSVYVGDIFDTRIAVKNVTELYKFSFKVKFDPKFFEVVGVKKESFLSWRPRPSSVKDADLWKNVVIDNFSGVAIFACDGTRKQGVSGSGYLAVLTLKCKMSGKSTIEFSNVFAYNNDGAIINIISRSTDIQSLEFHPWDKNQDGVVDILDSVTKGAPVSVKFSLDQNYPNPFNPETWIPYKLAKPADVTIKIYKMTGEVVKTLDLGYRSAGFYTDRTKSAYWDGMDDNGQKVSSGIYFFTIKAGDYTATKKMIVSK
jgi:hypothetical protein